LGSDWLFFKCCLLFKLWFKHILINIKFISVCILCLNISMKHHSITLINLLSFSYEIGRLFWYLYANNKTVE
jgi:hypothetical protein